MKKIHFELNVAKENTRYLVSDLYIMIRASLLTTGSVIVEFIGLTTYDVVCVVNWEMVEKEAKELATEKFAELKAKEFGIEEPKPFMRSKDIYAETFQEEERGDSYFDLWQSMGCL